MSKYNRYLFVKKIYPEYVIFISSKSLLKTFDYDLEIVESVGFDNFFNLNVNYLILDGLDIKSKISFKNNNYFYYFKFTLVKKIVYDIFYLEDR